MKILYMSCHSILEYDEVSLLVELGHEVFSPGAYVEPRNVGDPTVRPSIDISVDPDIRAQYDRIGAAHPGEDAKNYLTKNFVDNFDAVIVMHLPRWIKLNWHAMKHKRVIWRTIGQSVASTEQGLQPYRNRGLQIVRYSPREMNIPHFCGQDALIRFYKDLEEFCGWTGEEKNVITFAQSMQQRGTHCNYQTFELATRPFPRKLFGPENNQPKFGMGKVSFERLKEELRKNRVYFAAGTHPASYTLNFIEAMMTGIPLLCVGPKLGNADHLRDHNLYEIPDLIKHGENGFVTDSVGEMRSIIRSLFNDDKLAKSISEAGRKEAIRHFNKEMIKESWKAFLARP